MHTNLCPYFHIYTYIHRYIHTYIPIHFWASLVAQMVKNLPTVQEIWVLSLGQEDPLKDLHGNPLQYCCLEESGRLQSVESQSMGHD